MDAAGLHCGGQGMWGFLSVMVGLSQTAVGLKRMEKRETEDNLNRKFFGGVLL